MKRTEVQIITQLICITVQCRVDHPFEDPVSISGPGLSRNGIMVILHHLLLGRGVRPTFGRQDGGWSVPIAWSRSQKQQSSGRTR